MYGKNLTIIMKIYKIFLKTHAILAEKLFKIAEKTMHCKKCDFSMLIRKPERNMAILVLTGAIWVVSQSVPELNLELLL